MVKHADVPPEQSEGADEDSKGVAPGGVQGRTL